MKGREVPIPLGLLLLLAGPVGAQSAFSCTDVLGFSQTLEWFSATSLAEVGGPVGSVELETEEFLPSWQGRFTGGAALDRWKDPEFTGWQGTSRTPIVCERWEVDRVVFNVSGPGRSPEEWATDIIEVVNVLRTHYPNIERIALLPVVGPPGDGCEGVRAADNHLEIVEGIGLASSELGASVVAGPAPRVRHCAQYSDRLGHLTSGGAAHVHAQMMSEFSR